MQTVHGKDDQAIEELSVCTTPAPKPHAEGQSRDAVVTRGFEVFLCHNVVYTDEIVNDLYADHYQ